MTLPIKRALVSVSDKTGVLEFCKTLRETCGEDLEILSTGGTANLLKQNGMAVTDVSEYTGFPESMTTVSRTTYFPILIPTNYTFSNSSKYILYRNRVLLFKS